MSAGRRRIGLTIRALDRKLLRDLWRLRGQVLSIASLVMCGVATIIAMHGTLRSVQVERDRYYTRYRFGDVFAAGTRMPAGVAGRLEAIPGVRSVSPRAMLRVSLDVAGLDLPAGAQLISIPDVGEPALNLVHVTSGRMPQRYSSNEALVSAGFAAANAISAGDSIGVVMDGRWRRVRVTGVGMSPEYLWELAAADFFTADERAFGLLWMSQHAVEAAAGMRGAFNSVSLALGPDARVAAVRAAVDTLLAPYGGVGSVARDRQPSNYIIEQEFRTLRIFGTTIPVIFLAVAAFLLNVVLARLIAIQRPELAALKAFGYTDAEVSVHYLGFAAAAVLIGSAAGVALGMPLGDAYTGMYARYFRFPDLRFSLDPVSATLAIAASAGAALAGAAFAVRAAVRLPPAEALRPDSPTRYRPLLLERLGVGGALPTSARMLLRTLERRPIRTASAMLGVAMSVGMLAGTLAIFDAAYYMGDVIFRLGQREDVAVGFTHPRPPAAIGELRRIPGVILAEGTRGVPVRVRQGGVVRTVVLTGVPQPAILRRVVDEDALAYRVPPEGVVVSAGIASLLGVRRGDTLRLELIERGGTPRRVAVAGIARELVGANLYMDAAALDRLLGDDGRVTGGYLRVDRSAMSHVLATLKTMPGVSGASSRSALIAAWDRQMVEGIRISGTLIVVFAAIIALGVVYNGARISLSERGRELASLRVLGFTRAEVARLLFAEQALVVVAALPLGVVFGAGLARLITGAFESENQRLPLILEPRTFLLALGIVILASIGAGLLMRRRLHRMDLIAVLKTRE